MSEIALEFIFNIVQALSFDLRPITDKALDTREALRNVIAFQKRGTNFSNNVPHILRNVIPSFRIAPPFLVAFVLGECVASP